MPRRQASDQGEERQLAESSDLDRELARQCRRDGLEQMLVQAERGETSVLPALRELFDEEPHYWEQVGNVALQAQRCVLKLAAGKNQLAQEAMERKADELRQALAGPAPTALECLLVDRIVICWLQANDADRTDATRTQNGVDLALGDYLQRRQDRAHRRYLAAIKTLAQVRRLLGPAVQVNIAKQQVNVAG